MLFAWTALLFVGLMLLSGWWLQRNDLPNGFQNEADHLYTLSEVFFRFRDNSYADASDSLWGEYYPPLNHLLAGGGMSLFGRSRMVATLSLGATVGLLLFAVAFIGRRARDGPSAALAVLLVASYPSIFGNMRRYEPNIVLAALVALGLALLVTGVPWRSRGGAVCFGAVAGLGLLADRVVFAVYMAPVVAVLWLRLQGEPQRRRELLRKGVLAAAVALCLCGYYYVRFVQGHIDEILSQLHGEVDATGLETESYSLLSFRGLFYYPLSWFDCQMGPALAVFTGGGLLLYLFKVRSELAAEPRAVLESCLIGGLMIFTLVGKKQPFYSIPLLAPAALLAAFGWSSLRSARAASVIFCGVLLLCAHQVRFLTQHEGLVPSPGRWAWLAGASPFPAQWLGYEYTQAAAPFAQNLRLERAVQLCAGELSDQHPYTLLFSEGGAAEEGQLMPTLRLGLDTRLVEGLRKSPPEAIEENLSVTACFIYVATDGRHWPSSASMRATFARFNAGAAPAELVERIEELEDSARLLDSWMSFGAEEVHVYALVSGAEAS